MLSKCEKLYETITFNIKQTNMILFLILFLFLYRPINKFINTSKGFLKEYYSLTNLPSGDILGGNCCKYFKIQF